MKKGYLVFNDGTAFEGERIGAEIDSIGELVFTTGVEGYLETLTDPSYAGQIVVQTFPMIGNYGVITEDFEGDPALKGYVVGEVCDYPSNFRSEYELDRYLKENKIPGLCGVDTREITVKIREGGVTNAGIYAEIPTDLSALQSYEIKDVVKTVSTKKECLYQAKGNQKHNIALIDCGVKRNIIRSLNERGCAVTLFPCDVKAERILKGGFDGVMLTNGPGDPEDNVSLIGEIKKIIGKIPLFGICLGHQLVALAMGGKTMKLKYGHRGGNQPVKEVKGKRVYVTSQNHGYAVVAESLKGVGEEIFVNANDGSSEGMYYPGKKCFTVQFHPEAASGPRDAAFLFDQFIAMTEGKDYAEK